MSEERVLVAGVGNILHGDDGFGTFAIRELEQRGIPDDVRVTNFGLRSDELACEIRNGFDAVILLETASHGGEPGTLYVFDPDVDPVEAGQAVLGSKGMAPEDALRVLDAFDGYAGQIFILACEPESFESVDALSEAVESALPEAVSILDSILQGLLDRADVFPEAERVEPAAASLLKANRQPAAA